MLKIMFWVYIVSAVLAFLYLFVFAHIAIAYFSHERKAEGQVRIKTRKNWAKVCISFIQCILIIGLPVLNTFFVTVWLCNTDKCMEQWEELARKNYCYPDELP